MALPIECQDRSAFAVAVHDALAEQGFESNRIQVADQDRWPQLLVATVKNLEHEKPFMLATNLHSHLIKDQKLRAK